MIITASSWVLWLHVLGAVIWIGGVAFVVSVLRPALQRALDPPERRGVLKHVASRMQRIINLVIALQVITGLLLAWPFLRGGLPVLQSPWGRTLILKVALVVCMIVIYALTPRLLLAGRQRLGSMLHFGLLGLGLVVIFLGTLLG